MRLVCHYANPFLHACMFELSLYCTYVANKQAGFFPSIKFTFRFSFVFCFHGNKDVLKEVERNAGHHKAIPQDRILRYSSLVQEFPP